jgi:hypothetical protein
MGRKIIVFWRSRNSVAAQIWVVTYRLRKAALGQLLKIASGCMPVSVWFYEVMCRCAKGELHHRILYVSVKLVPKETWLTQISTDSREAGTERDKITYIANAPDVLQPCGLLYYYWYSNSHHQSSYERSWRSEVELNIIIFRSSNFHH